MMMTSRSKRATSPEVPAEVDQEAELQGKLLATEGTPPDVAGAVAALPDLVDEPTEPGAVGEPTPPPSTVPPQPPKRGPGRPKGSGKGKASPMTGKPRRRSKADIQAENDSLRAQLASAQPDHDAIAQAAQALAGSFMVVGTILGEYVHPTMDISDKAAELGQLWAPCLEPHFGDIADNLPWIVAGAGTLALILPNYKAWKAATSPAELSAKIVGDEPGKEPETVGVGVMTVETIRPRGAL